MLHESGCSVIHFGDFFVYDDRRYSKAGEDKYELLRMQIMQSVGRYLGLLVIPAHLKTQSARMSDNSPVVCNINFHLLFVAIDGVIVNS